MMFGLLKILQRRSEAAFRSAVLATAAAGLLVVAIGFIAGASVLLLAEWMPLWAALLCGAGVLIVIAALCLWAATAKAPAPAQPQPAAEAASLLGLAASSGSLRDALLRFAEHEARTNPAYAAFIAAAVGLVIGALDARANKTGAGKTSADQRQ